jgi:hypothetical protein
MRMSEFAILFGVFMLVFFSANSFLHAFNLQQTLPQDIQKAWNKSYEQVEKARMTVEEKVNSLTKEEKNLIEKMYDNFAIAFGLIQYIAMSVYAVFVSIPTEIFGAIRYMASTLGIDPMIITIVTSVLTVIVVIKLIEFLTGRHGL